MATTINLGALEKVAFADGDLDLIKITINGTATALRALGGKITNGTTITCDYGTFTKPAATDVNITFTAAASYPAGTVTLTAEADAAKALLAKVDFSATTGAVTVTGTAKTTTILGGLGDDNLTAEVLTTSIVGGAGNDTITSGVTGGVASTVKGGLGADKFIQSDAVNVSVDDYNYAEGDTVTQKAAFTGAALTSAGQYTDTNVTVKATLADSAYKVKVTDGAGTAVTKEYWTGAAGSSAITLDGSAKTDALVINTSNSLNAVITGGKGNDSIALGTSQATVTASKADGTDTITGFTMGFTGDVLNLKNATLSDVTWAANSTIGLNTTLNGIGAAAKDEILVQENGGAVKKVAFSTVTAQSLAMTDTKVADAYIGFASTTNTDTTNLDASAVTNPGTVINLLETTKYKNITEITGAAGGGVYVGAVNSHDTTGATGTKFTLGAVDKASQVWGGSKAADTIALKAANTVQDVVWFGTTDGADKVTGFSGGFKSTNDLVNLYDVTDLSSVKFTQGAGVTDVIVTAATGNTVELGGAGAANIAQLQLKDKAGNVKKVSVATATGVAVNGVGADVAVGFSDNTTGVTYDATQTDNLVVNLLDTAKYKNIKNVNLTGIASGANVVIGSSTLASDITLGGTMTDVWGGSSFANNIKTGAGVDTIWFGANDGADVVAAGFGTTDKVKFYDKSIANLATAYTWDDAGAKLTSTAKATDSLTVTGVGTDTTINVLDKDNKAAKMVVGAAGLTYASDAKVYMGAAATLTVGSTDNVVLYLGNGKDATVNDIYFNGVTTIDAATSTGQTILIGSKTTADVLKGGTTSSAMWGGGNAADQMVGQVNAVDQFWFGTGDGADSVTGAGTTKQDKIVLYNITSIADVTVTANTNDFVVTAKDGSTLSVADTGLAALDGGIAFQFGADTSAKSYTYNKVSKTFVAK